jgi:crotonobetainyl-CoA:carnitine CoA-transferase CaiB-like acyl-CoA transferase
MGTSGSTPAPAFLEAIWSGLGGSGEAPGTVKLKGAGELPSAFAATDFASAAVAAAGLSLSKLLRIRFEEAPAVTVDRRLASLWFGMSITPQGWTLPPPWDPVAGDYETNDGWIRLHTNAPHHREAALTVLGAAAEREAVAAAVRRWQADELEAAVVSHGGCAAVMRSLAAWRAHPQGRAVAAEAVVSTKTCAAAPESSWTPSRDRPLRGVRVLDLTRVLAGPVATRFLAGFGAEVLRIDPPGWDEPGVVPEVTLGKRCARLDLTTAPDRERFTKLLAGADVFVHGLRPGALTGLGFDAETRRQICPGLIDVCLDAYGWSGPWSGRRGFDSLVQMSTGIAAEGMRYFGTDKPKPLPVQALDHTAGYVMAAAVIHGLSHRVLSNQGFEARTSLARLAALLTSAPAGESGPAIAPAAGEDFAEATESTAWGPAKRLKPPLDLEGAPMFWPLAASPLGSAQPEWQSAPAQ